MQSKCTLHLISKAEKNSTSFEFFSTLHCQRPAPSKQQYIPNCDAVATETSSKIRKYIVPKNVYPKVCTLGYSVWIFLNIDFTLFVKLYLFVDFRVLWTGLPMHQVTSLTLRDIFWMKPTAAVLLENDIAKRDSYLGNKIHCLLHYGTFKSPILYTLKYMSFIKWNKKVEFDLLIV